MRAIEAKDDGRRLVWDLPVRVAHWALVAGVAGAFATHYAGTAWFAWHRACGYAVFVTVAFRILWGVVGTRHARFASFVRGPRAVLSQLAGRGRVAGAGHSPLAALSVVAMLAVVAVQALTGLCANDEIANTGPFYGWITPAASNRLTAVHAWNSKLLLGLVGLHLAAIAWYALARGRRLVRAMIDGRRPATEVAPDEAIDGSRTWLAIALAAMVAGALALAVRAAPPAEIAIW
ncbi:MAG: cytochrome b/b6 domain-containing protein [Steroidobacteraceae bacterium]